MKTRATTQQEQPAQERYPKSSSRRRADRRIRSSKRARTFWLWSFCVGVMCVILLGLGLYWMRSVPVSSSTLSLGGSAAVGAVAPEVRLSIAGGGTFDLAQERGHLLLLSFLQTQPDTAATPSRNQAVVLESMRKQYATAGVNVAIVDTSLLVSGVPVSTSSLVNVGYDWNMGAVQLLQADSLTVFQLYGIQNVPTTFLIDSAGRVQQRWNGFISTQQVAPVLQSLTGTPTP